MLSAENVYQQPLFKFDGEEIYFHNLSMSTQSSISRKASYIKNYTKLDKNYKNFHNMTMDISIQDYLLYGCVKFYLSLLENNVSLENPTFPGNYIVQVQKIFSQ